MPNKRSINARNRNNGYGYGHGHVPVNGGQTASDYAPNPEVYHAAAKKGGGKKVLIIVLVALLSVLVAGGTAFGLYVANVGSNLNRGTKSDGELIAIQEKLSSSKPAFDEVFYMLLLGSDSRNDGEPARSDVNIVARIDPVANSVSLLSIPRDTKIKIEDYGTQKFNAAYSFNQVPGAIDAAEELLGVKISHYAEIDFTGLKNLVDAVGGVTVDVEGDINDFHCDDGDGKHYVLKKGEQTLNGGEALTYARSRYSFAEGDYARASHQRQIIEAIMHEVLNASPTQLPGIIAAASECLTTDLQLTDIVALAQQFADVGKIAVYDAVIPSYPQNINGISFVVVDDDKLKDLMKLYKKGKDCSRIKSEKVASPVYDDEMDTSMYMYDVDDEGYGTGAGITPDGSGAGSGGNSGTSIRNDVIYTDNTDWIYSDDPSPGSSLKNDTDTSSGGIGISDDDE